MVSIAELQESVALAEALCFRQAQEKRVNAACQDLSPLLEQWGHMKVCVCVAWSNGASGLGMAGPALDI